MPQNSKLNTRIILRNDSSQNWETAKDTILFKGEVGIEFPKNGAPKIKIGDGETSWENLPYFATDSTSGGTASIFEATVEGDEEPLAALQRVVGVSVPKQGDIGIVKKVITGEKVEYTAFVYDGSVWKAMDGNYNATNVYFDSDLTITANIGVQTVTSGSKTLETTGKNLKQVLDMIMAQEKNPSITQPSCSVTLNNAKAYEVGTSFTPTGTVNFNPGKYQYGDTSTGVTATAYQVSDTNSNSSDQASFSFPAFTVEDGTNYKVSATVTHSEATKIPTTNLGNPYEAGKIQAGSKKATSSSVTSYRNTFYGTVETKEEITESVIRGLSASNKTLSNGSSFNVSVPVDAIRVIVAYPATLRDLTSAKDVNGMNAESVTSFKKMTVNVGGVNSYSPIEYKVFYLDFANPNDTQNTFAITI